MSGGNVNVCDIPDEVTEALKKFRFKKHTGNSALILKVEREKQRVWIDEEVEDIEIEQLQELLPSHQPRYIIYRTSIYDDTVVKHFLTNRVVDAWNKLPQDVIDSPSTNIFKNRLDKYIRNKRYKMEHSDGRTSFPMCFIYYTPRDSQTELQIMYAGTKRALAQAADLTRAYEVRELDELTETWLREKLK